MSGLEPSAFRVEKRRARAVLTLTSGMAVGGHFFLAEASATLSGHERVAELLNSEPGFFPFEHEDGQAILYNRAQVVTVELADDEARRDSGYATATARIVSIQLSNGQRLRGSVRVYRPGGQDRLSDWARHGQRYRYLETAQATFIVNVEHIVSVREEA